VGGASLPRSEWHASQNFARHGVGGEADQHGVEVVGYPVGGMRLGQRDRIGDVAYGRPEAVRHAATATDALEQLET
jgi:hypothetical protein